MPSEDGKKPFLLSEKLYAPLPFFVFVVGVTWMVAELFVGQRATNEKHAQALALVATREELRALRAENLALWHLFKASLPQELRPAVPEIPK